MNHPEVKHPEVKASGTTVVPGGFQFMIQFVIRLIFKDRCASHRSSSIGHRHCCTIIWMIECHCQVHHPLTSAVPPKGWVLLAPCKEIIFSSHWHSASFSVNSLLCIFLPFFQKICSLCISDCLSSLCWKLTCLSSLCWKLTCLSSLCWKLTCLSSLCWKLTCLSSLCWKLT